MHLKVLDIIEHEDGSANVVFEMDQKTFQKMAEVGVLKVLTDAATEIVETVGECSCQPLNETHSDGCELGLDRTPFEERKEDGRPDLLGNGDRSGRAYDASEQSSSVPVAPPPVERELRSEPVPNSDWLFIRNEGDRSLWKNTETDEQEWFLVAKEELPDCDRCNGAGKLDPNQQPLPPSSDVGEIVRRHGNKLLDIMERHFEMPEDFNWQGFAEDIVQELLDEVPGSRIEAAAKLQAQAGEIKRWRKDAKNYANLYMDRCEKWSTLVEKLRAQAEEIENERKARSLVRQWLWNALNRGEEMEAQIAALTEKLERYQAAMSCLYDHDPQLVDAIRNDFGLHE